MKKNTKSVLFSIIGIFGSLVLSSPLLFVNFNHIDKNPEKITLSSAKTDARNGTYSVTLKNNVSLFEFPAPEEYRSFKASDFNQNVIKQLVISNLNDFFNISGTIPSGMFDYNNNQYFIINEDSIVKKDFSGTVQFTFRLNSANDDPSNNNNTLTQTVLITGLRSYVDIHFKNQSVFELGDPFFFVDDPGIATVDALRQLVIDNRNEILIYDKNDLSNFDWEANVKIANEISSNDQIIINRELGTIKFLCKIGDAQKQITISGYKRFYEIQIDYEVETSINVANLTIPGTNNLIGSQVFADDSRLNVSGGIVDEWFKNQIIENKDYLFTFTKDFPVNFDFAANLEIGRKYSNVNQGVLDVTFTLKNATNGNVEDKNLTGSIIFKGFLKKWQVKFKKPNNENMFNLGDSRYYADDTQNINEEWIRNTIIRNKSTMFSEINNGFNYFNWITDLEISSITPNRQDCCLSFKIRMINTTNHPMPEIINETIIFTGFLPLPYSISMTQNEFSEFANETVFATDFDSESLKALIIQNKNIFFSTTNVPRAYRWEENLSITKIVANNESGTIKFNFSLNNANNNGQTLSKNNVLITNFKKAYRISLTRATISDFFPRQVEIDESVLLSEDGDVWLTKQIYKNREKIFKFTNDCPTDRSWWLRNMTITNIQVIDDRVTFNLSLTNFTDDPTETRESINKTINLTGLNIKSNLNSNSNQIKESKKLDMWSIAVIAIIPLTLLAFIIAIVVTKSKKNKI